MKRYSADEIYGISRNLPLNYVERSGVDDVFRDSINRKTHIIIHGSSKQGKTSLRKKWLLSDSHIVISCSNNMSIGDLNASILKKVGYKIEQLASKTISGVNKISAEFGGSVRIPIITSLEAKGSGTIESKEEIAIHKNRLDLDPTDSNDIIGALRDLEFSKQIVLEDFHYLPPTTQRDFTFSLKAYHENSDICFIIVGVWRDSNRLTYYNGDLSGRVISIDAENWNASDLDKVIILGEDLLNISLDAQFKRDIIQHSLGSVYLVQEACRRECAREGIKETCSKKTEIKTKTDAKSLISDIVNEQAGRYNTFINNFCGGFKSTELEMYRWLLYSIISFSIEMIESGLQRSQISKEIKLHHPRKDQLNEGNITQALTSISSLQVNGDIRPIILAYDDTNRILNVVDRGFIIWLSHQDKSSVLQSIMRA